MNWQKKLKEVFSISVRDICIPLVYQWDQYDECYVRCIPGVFVITASSHEIWAYPGSTATPLIRPNFFFFFFGLLVTVLKGFHCNNYFFFIFSKSDNYFFLIIISFRLKNKSKNSKISRTNSEATLGPPDATLKRSWAARILYFALRRSNKRDVTLTHLRSAVWNPIMYCQEYFTLLTTKPKSILGASVPDALYELWTVSVFN